MIWKKHSKPTRAKWNERGLFPPKLLEARKPNEKVYEFRSGVLIPMIIDEKRGLIPDIAGDIISFKNYQYTPEARRIYNLPGKFELKVDKK